MLGLSETYLLRIFHREVGQTFRSYLLSIRMIRAADLVKHIARPLKQIAFECGYSDISNFYRDFRKVHGTTPGRLRDDELLKHVTDLPEYMAPLIHVHASSVLAGVISPTNIERQ